VLPSLVAVLALGALHGLGPDHAAAVAALSVRAGRVREALAIALRFALGHGAVFALSSVAARAVLAALPSGFERACEVLGGVALAVLGVVTLLGSVGVHTHGEAGLHRHLPAQPMHRHGRGALDAGLGAVFALSSARTLALSGPWTGAGAGQSLLLALAFAAGVLASMSAVALLLTTLSRDRSGAQAILRRTAGAAALGLGCFWAVWNAAR
jgi:nickel/cobalt transporter (NicO) family protein